MLEKKRAAAYISKAALRNNVNVIKSYIDNNTKVSAVVKADAYGHGMKEVTESIDDIIDYYIVAIEEEAYELRKYTDKDILLLGYATKENIEKVFENKITLSLLNDEYMNFLKKEALKRSKKLKVHLKLDTAMRRVGYYVDWNDIDKTVNKISDIIKDENFIFEGLYSHFSTADNENLDFALQQGNIFKEIVDKLKDKGIIFDIVHMANSAAIFKLPQFHFDMVRTGIILYGLHPSDYVYDKRLIPVMSFVSHIAQIKEIKKGDSIGYSRKFISDRNMKTAVIPVGYADGVSRLLANKGVFYIKNRPCKILGNICMDQCVVDITGMDVTLYERAELFSDSYNIASVSKLMNTIDYEVTCLITKRVPRILY
mgnify:CR=1 FL=1